MLSQSLSLFTFLSFHFINILYIYMYKCNSIIYLIYITYNLLWSKYSYTVYSTKIQYLILIWLKVILALHYFLETITRHWSTCHVHNYSGCTWRRATIPETRLWIDDSGLDKLNEMSRWFSIDLSSQNPTDATSSRRAFYLRFPAPSCVFYSSRSDM